MCLPFLLPQFAGRGQLAIPLGEDFEVAIFQSHAWSNIADGAVQTDLVIVRHEMGDEPRGIVQRQRHLDAKHSPFSVLCQRSILPLLCG